GVPITSGCGITRIGADGIRCFRSLKPFVRACLEVEWIMRVCLPMRAGHSTGALLPNVVRQAECWQGRVISPAFAALLRSGEAPAGLLLRWPKLGQTSQSRSRTCQQSRLLHNAT